jgi:hypothetical protein
MDRYAQFYLLRTYCVVRILYTLIYFFTYFFKRALPGNLVEGDMLCQLTLNRW